MGARSKELNVNRVGPEIGLVGLGLNVAFAAVLWQTLRRGMVDYRPRSAKAC
jgi:hypothetical protein